MITTPAILQGDTKRYIDFNAEEHPVVLQLGGSNAQELAKSCVIAEEFGYDEVNLNVGCPSDRVQKGRFGACLMNEPELVVQCIQVMQQSVSIPITVKCRIGVDNNDSYENLSGFVQQLEDAGLKTLIIHARKALLKGLSPKQNRSVPPLNYEFVYRIKQEHPELSIIINGGINTVDETITHLENVDGVMLGRAVWNNPWLLHELQNKLFQQNSDKTRDQVLEKYIHYCESELKKDVKLHWLLPPVLNLYHGIVGNKKWKSHLVTQATKRENDLSVFTEAKEYINE
jgi:tRNA-dihydrouridine synthase A